MAKESQTTPTSLDKALAELARLRQFGGPPNEFWPRLLAALQELTPADQLVLLARQPGQPWRRLLTCPAESSPSRMLTEFATRLEAFAEEAVRDDGQVISLEAKAGPLAGNFVIVTRLNLGTASAREECVLVGLLSEVSEARARDALVRVRLAAPTVECYLSHGAAQQARADAERFASVLDLSMAFSGEKHFLATTLAFCNGVAARFTADRVSLGWLDGGYIHLRAISRTEKFDRRMAAAQALEIVMEEALDQDDEVIWPAPPGQAMVTRDHERFAREQNAGHLCSLPLRVEKAPVAVLTCERRGAPFTPAEVQQLRLACDLAAARLADLHRADRWFGARWAARLREAGGGILGPEHTWAKILALTLCAALVTLVLLRVPYRVQGNFLLRTDASAYLTAPFDGYIDQVLVRPGDAVAVGAPLLKLKTSELELEEAYAVADVNRFLRDAEKARAAKQLADMRISEAMADQARARLEIIRHRLEQATIRAPFAGVIIEGDLRERLGSPVKAADILLREARVDGLYAEAEVNERDIHDILGHSSGEIAFVSQPNRKFPVHITAIEQAALPKNEANVFLVRCAPEPGPQPWWRPGMSGVCKFDVEKRPLLWVLTHRTVDFLRLKLWW